MNTTNNEKISKRQFLKKTVVGLSGLALGLNYCNLFADSDVKETSLPDSENQPTSYELWKWSKEAKYYSQTARGVKCKLCPNECSIKPGDLGDCRARLNNNNKLYSVVYGNPCAIHEDPIEKKPLYHFYPASRAFSIATAGCNLACLNCQNWTISQANPYNTNNYDLMPAKVVEQALLKKCKSIAYTYSDPIVFYEYVYDTAKIARQKGIKNVFVSAGYIHEAPLRNIAKYLDAANIDLKSFDESIYERLNGGTLQTVLQTLKVLKEENVWLEITNLVIPGWTDDFDMIKKMCDWLYTNNLHTFPLHFSRFKPMYKLTQLPPTPLETLEKAREIALKSGIKYVYIGNVPGTKAENTYCPKCGKTVIERKGYRVLSNNIENNKCKFCGETIHGKWK